MAHAQNRRKEKKSGKKMVTRCQLKFCLHNNEDHRIPQTSGNGCTRVCTQEKMKTFS